MGGGPGSFKRTVSLTVTILYFLSFCGPLEALRCGSVRLVLGPPPAYAQAGVAVDFAPGLNLFSSPITVPTTADTCFELLALLGGPTGVESISRFNTTTQLFKGKTFPSSPARRTSSLCNTTGWDLTPMTRLSALLFAQRRQSALSVQELVRLERK